jgi:hypothetical protein
MVELPGPDASDELINYVDEIGQSAESWHGISAALLKREQATGEIQTGWLMTAFEYHLRHPEGEARTQLDAFTDYPNPIPSLPEEVVALWASTADRVHAAALRARLHHLLFERGHGNKGTHGREAAKAYLELGSGNWGRLERAHCLQWAVNLSKRIGDRSEAANAYPALVELASESLDQEKKEPGVALDALETLAFEDTTNPELPQLLERARAEYGDNPYLASKTIQIQEQVFKSDPTKRDELRREIVEAFCNYAEKFPPGAMRMAFFEDSAKLANQYGVPDLADKAISAMQAMSIGDLHLQTFTATASIPAQAVDTHVAKLVEQSSLDAVLHSLASGEAPTGNIDRNMASTEMIAKQTPFAALIPTKHIGVDALPRYTATSDAERLDEQLARIEIVGLSMGGEVAARVLEAALARFSPSEEELTSLLQVQPHVSASIARSLARALLDFQSESYEEATTVAMPKIESLVRELLREQGVLRFRPEREQRQGPSTRGQFPQLGALLGQIKPWLDQSWYRFLWTFLVSPFGPNYRNELLHGFTEDVTRIPAALTILAGLRLALVPLNSDPETDESGPGEVAASASPD